MADGLSIWVPFLSAMGGGAITIVAQQISEVRRVKAERTARQEALHERVLLRRCELQHTALVEFQDAIERLTEELGKEVIAYEKLKTDMARNNHRSKFMDSELTRCILRTQKLRHRISDSAIRDSAKSLLKAANAEQIASTLGVNDETTEPTYGDLLHSLHDLIGETMHKLDSEILATTRSSP